MRKNSKKDQVSLFWFKKMKEGLFYRYIAGPGLIRYDNSIERSRVAPIIGIVRLWSFSGLPSLISSILRDKWQKNCTLLAERAIVRHQINIFGKSNNLRDRVLGKMTKGTLSCGRAIALVGFFWAVLGPWSAYAQSDMSPPLISPYVISDLQIDASAENAVRAREKAFQDALFKSYIIMIERLVPDARARATMRTPDATELGRLLADFTTKNEQLGPMRYTATYEMRFKPHAVRTLILAGGPLPVSGGAAPEATAVAEDPVSSEQEPARAGENVLVLPFYQPGAHPVLWSGINPLRDALQHANLQGSRIKAPLGDLEDVQSFDEGHALTFSPQELGALLARYEARTVIVAIAVPDEKDSMLKGLSVLLYRATLTAPEPKYLQALTVEAALLPGQAAVYARAIDKIRALLPILLSESDQEDRVIAPAPVEEAVSTEARARDPQSTPQRMQAMQVRTKFRDLQEWQQTRGRLAAVAGLQTLRVLSLKTQEARMELLYGGADMAFFDHLKAAGFEMSPVEESPESIPVMTGPLPSTGLPMVYDLTYNPWREAGGKVVKP